MDVFRMLWFIYAPIIVVFLVLWVAKRPRIRTLAHDYELPWYQMFEFNLRISLPSEQQARACAAAVNVPDARVVIERTPKGERWSIEWIFARRGSGAWYRALCMQILHAGFHAGEPDPIIIATAKGLNDINGLFLDSFSLKELPVQ